MKNWTIENIGLVSRNLDQLKKNSYSISDLQKTKRGLEKESLRITHQGVLSTEPHPEKLGAALTHPNITTDYSEALLEFITPPYQDSIDAIRFLKQLHALTYQHLNEELLWVNSMPCLMKGEESIPIARYGKSNSGRMKSIYRNGLGYRYGRFMQTIAGIHYNFSLPLSFWQSYQRVVNNEKAIQTFINDEYFRLIRNFQRYSWIPVYLFGASPMVCESYIEASQKKGTLCNLPPELVSFIAKNKKGTRYLPLGTSLRMSSLGYHNTAQADLHISYNSLNEYIDSLESAIRCPSSVYEKIGLYHDNERIQLNTNILQIENEFYNSIRPKRTSQSGERPTVALKKEGVEYIEIRLLDLNPNIPGGIDATTLDFMDIFLLFCLLIDSPLLFENEQATIQNNLQSIVTKGRDLSTSLVFNHQNNETVSIKDYFALIFPIMEPIAEFLDTAYNTSRFSSTLHGQQAKAINPSLTPSFQIIEAAREGGSYYQLGMEQAERQREYFLNLPIEPENIVLFDKISTESHQKQIQIEQTDQLSLEEYIESYFKID